MNGKLRGRFGGAGALLLATLLVGPALEAQTPTVRSSRVPMAMAASAGSFAGLMGGAMLGVRTGWGNDGEDSWTGVIVLASAGAIAGTVIGMKLASCGEVATDAALGASLAGFAAGLAVSYALASTTRGGGLPVVFSVSQGVVAGLVAGARGR